RREPVRDHLQAEAYGPRSVDAPAAGCAAAAPPRVGRRAGKRPRAPLELSVGVRRTAAVRYADASNVAASRGGRRPPLDRRNSCRAALGECLSHPVPAKPPGALDTGDDPRTP